MFYSQFILAKKGPLGTIWIAAHLERKLRKNQVADTDIGVSVDSILFPEVPIALRLSSHLLLGVVRIYSRKVNYLFDDCSEALLKVKQAFRSTAVDLPPEETTAPYHSITLPETFDLDDFELPDNDIFQGNYVDHHVSAREQITLQDTMEGVVYSASQFGLDERFADGDTSQVGSELDEDLFLDKVATTRLDEVSEVHPQVSIEQMTDPERHLSHGMVAGSSDAAPANGTRNKIEGLHGNSQLLDYAEAPSTPGLVEEPNFFSVQKGLASEDHLGSEDHNSMEVLGVESMENVCSKSDIHHASDAKVLSLNSNLNGDAVTCLPPEEISHLSGELEMSHSMLQRNLSSTVVTMECVMADGNTAALDGLRKAENMYNGGLGNSEPSLPIDKMKGESGKSIGFRLNETDVVEVADNKKELHSLGKSVQSNDVLSSELSGTCDVEVQACQQIKDDETLNHGDNEQMISACVDVVRASHVKQAKGSSDEVNDHMFSPNLQSEDAVPLPSECFKKKLALHACGTSTKVQGEEWHMTDGIELEENQILRPTMHGEVQADGANLDRQQDNATSSASPFEKLDGSVTSDLSAPEKLLSVPQMLPDKPDGLLVESTPDKEVPDGSSGGSLGTVISGKKRSFIECSLSGPSFNEVESYGVTRSKITTGSIPDDDDLLSSILVGRKSSVLKMKLTPTAPEIASTKRVRFSSGHGSLKRKVLMDNSMVLHGDTIRQQLTNTEDIRRLRKKAPCTHAEILMIQRQFVEQDIFSETVLTGMPAELACLHCESFDLSRIVVSERDEHDTALGMEKDEECYARPIFTEDRGIKGITVPVSDGNDFDMQFAEFAVETENQHGDHELGSYDVDKQGHTNIISDLSNHKISKYEHLEKISSMEIDGGNAEVVDVLNHSVVGFDPSQAEPFSGDNSNTLTDKLHERIDGIGDIDNYPDNKIADETVFLVMEGNQVSESVGIGEDVLLDSSTPAANADAFLAKESSETGRCIDTTSVKVDQVPDDIENDKVRAGNECGGPARSSGFDDKDQTSNYLCSELAKPVDGDYEKEFLNDGAYPVCREADQQSTMDAETSLDHPAMLDQGDFQDVIFANDTEFLNVDDDEIGKDEQDGMPSSKDTHLHENSGWSSRTRAVAKYLQTLLDSEGGHGRKVLSMDNLLADKTCKEASRMFFETLVLKTRDYLHVEQAKPFDTINIKSRGKFLKSDF
uniref:Uncharacterized protein MANES_S013200 n=1 Tax=Rhizophora mucronata TaxID=61149 RepID=A0A2P2MQ58_RHIMU